ncbi:MAG TPA: HEAT repeat domain-containing protein [Herpetosiphonaceae bacterium]
MEPTDAYAGKGVFTTDSRLVIQLWDAGLTRMTGIAAASACGRHLTAVVPDLEARGLLDRFARALTHGTVELLAPALHQYLIPCAPQESASAGAVMRQRVMIAPLREETRIVGVLVTLEDVAWRRAHPDGPRDADAADTLYEALGAEDWRRRRAAVAGLIAQDSPDMIAHLLRSIRTMHHSPSVLNSALQVLAQTAVDVVPALAELLGDPDPDLRVYAILALSDHPDPRTDAALLVALHDGDMNVRFHAIDALGKLRVAAAIEPLLALAETREFFLAFPALDALRRIDDGIVLPRLLPLLADPLLQVPVIDMLGAHADPAAALLLADVLRQPTPNASAAVAALAALQQRFAPLPGVAARLLDELRRAWSPSATAQVIAVLEQGPPAQLAAAVRVLGWLDDPAADHALLTVITHSELQGSVIEALARHSARTLPLLLALFASDDAERRLAAAVAAGRIGSAQAVPALITALSDEPEVAIAAARALAQVGDRRAFDALIALLDADDTALRHAAIAAINSLGHDDTSARIGVLLQDPNPMLRESAVRIAGYFGFAQHGEALLRAAADPDEQVRQAAVEHLPYLDDARAVPVVLAALQRDTAKVRAVAARALAHADPEQAAPALTQALADTDAWVRYFALEALGRHQWAPATEAIAACIEADPAYHVRLAGLKALGLIGGAAASQALLQYAQEAPGPISQAAVEALATAPSDAALPVLIAAVRSPDPERRCAALQALAPYPRDEVVQVIQWAVASDAEPSVRQAGVRTLAAYQTPAAIDALVGLLIDPERRPLVIDALARLPAAAIPQLGMKVAHPHPIVRRAIIEVFTRLSHPIAASHLVAALDDPDPTVRSAAIRAVSLLGTVAARPRLGELAAADPDAAVRRAAQRALGIE